MPHKDKVHTALTDIPTSKSRSSCSHSPRVTAACTTPAVKEEWLLLYCWLGKCEDTWYTTSGTSYQKNLWFKCNGMHTLWYWTSIRRKIKVEQLISYMSIFSKETWYQAVKTRNLAMQSSAKDRASCNIPTVQRDRDSSNTWLLPAIILMSLVSTQVALLKLLPIHVLYFDILEIYRITAPSSQAK